MTQAKRYLFLIGGSVLVLIGIPLLLLPGPGMLVIAAGLFLLAKEHPPAREWLRKFQHMLSRSATWLDNWLAERKRRKA